VPAGYTLTDTLGGAVATFSDGSGVTLLGVPVSMASAYLIVG